MIKNINTKKGISLIVLLITIAVILILLTAITFSADSIINNTKKKQFAKEIYEVQNLINRYKYENDDYPYIIENDEKKIININVENIKEQFIEEDILNNTVTLYQIDLSKAGVQNLTRGINKNDNENDVYTFSDKTGKVYYVKGYKVRNTTYYTLTDELKSLVGYNSNKNESNSKVIGEMENNGYVTDGLILYLDGVNNSRNGHSTDTNVWEDLSGIKGSCNLVNFSYDEGSGWSDDGLIFDGNDDGVYLNNKINDLFNGDFTIEFVLKCAEENVRDVLVGNYSSNANINFENFNNCFRIFWNNGALDHICENKIFEKDKLKNICITLDKNKGILKVYENGKLLESITNDLFTSYNFEYNSAYIGRDSRTGNTCFKGSINLVRIYKKQLKKEEIRHNYESNKKEFNIE